MPETTLLDDPNFREFYVTAKKSTYAAGGDQKAEILPNGGKRYVFYDRKQWPQWLYTDIYHGDNPFFGNEFVEEVGGRIMPSVWMQIAQMSYGGYAQGTEDEVKRIFTFLQEMLQRVTVRSLFRGPIGLTRENGLEYHCKWKRWNPFHIDGREYITDDNCTLTEKEPLHYHLDFQFSTIR